VKLTIKDKEFLERLKSAMDQKALSVELKTSGVRRLVLRQNYGDRIEREFRMTRQGVRWRFQRLFNEIYVSAYETIYWIESQFGTALRQDALAIARERIQERKNLEKIDETPIYRREKGR
jgi:hypothetical protein